MIINKVQHQNQSISKIIDLILNLEREYDLLNWKINNIYVWQSARTSIYLLLLNMIIPSHASKKKMAFKTDLIRTICHRIFINSLLFNPFFDCTKTEVLIFESGRKYLVDGNYIDIYTKYLCDELRQENKTYTKYGTSYLYDYLTPRNLKVKHIDFIYIASKLLSKLINATLTAKDMKKIKTIENVINSSFNVWIDLATILVNEIKRFKSQYFFFNRLFRLKKAEIVYLVSSSEKAPLIKAAKDNNMVVNELQHGLITKDGVVDNFPHAMEDSLEYFPNNFFIWDDLDACTAKLPLSNKHIIPIKNKHLNYELKQHQNISRKANQILIISQPYVSKELVKFVVDNIGEMQNWHFIYKLHPADNHDLLKQELSILLEKYKNLNMVNNDKSMYALLAESRYVIGVFSTALFEASYFGCEVLLLNLPGVEHASILIKQNKAKLINTNERLLEYL